jgi:hypothetical protein
MEVAKFPYGEIFGARYERGLGLRLQIPLPPMVYDLIRGYPSGGGAKCLSVTSVS